MTNWEQHLQHTGWAKFLPWFSAFSLYGNKGLHHPDLAPLSPLPHLSYPKPTPLIPGDCIWGEGTIFHCRPPMLTELFLFLIFTFTMGKYSLLLLPLPLPFYLAGALTDLFWFPVLRSYFKIEKILVISCKSRLQGESLSQGLNSLHLGNLR